jgi:glycosyltransferase involved in cell wall biosynthesis
MDKPTATLVSVIIPAYNAEGYIKQTIDSALAQTYKNIEVIVIDDGSSDNTISVIEKFGDKVNLFKQPNAGVSKARNHAISLAKGYWVAFIDADDIWEPKKLETQIKSLNNARWSHTNSLYIGANQDGKTSRSELTKQYGGDIFSKLIVNNFITTSTVLIERVLINEFNGFDESLEALEDWKLWIEISKTTEIAYNPELLAKYRVYDGSTSRKARKVLPLHLKVITSVFGELPRSHRNQSLEKEALSQSFAICSYIAEDSTNYSFSLYCAYKAILNKPISVRLYKRVARTLINCILGRFK